MSLTRFQAILAFLPLFAFTTSAARANGTDPGNQPHMLVTSETYVEVSLSEDANGRVDPNAPANVEVIDVHRVQVAGDLSPASAARLERIAMQGVIRSYDRQTQRVIASIGHVNSVSTNAPGLVDAYGLGEQGTRVTRFPLEGSITNRDLIERFGLTGIVSATDDSVQLASVRGSREDSTESDPDASTSGGGANQSVFWASAGDLLNRVNANVSTYVRYDSLDSAVSEDVSTVVVVAQPGVSLKFDQSRWSLSADYKLVVGQYFDSRDDDFYNHSLKTNYVRKVNRANRFTLGAQYTKFEDQQSTSVVEDFNAVESGRVESENVALNTGWQYSRNGDKQRYNWTASVADATAESAINASGFERRSYRTGLKASYRVRRRLTLLVDGSYQIFDYEGRDDSDQYQLGSGVEFWLSRRLTARLQAGYQVNEYPDVDDDTSGVVWQGDVTWRPARRTTLNFKGAREFLESFERNNEVVAGESTIQQYGQLSWQQRWMPNWQSRVSMTFQEVDYPGNTDDEDNYQLSMGTSYRPNPRLTLGGDGVYTMQLTDGSKEFDRWTLTFRADYDF